MTKQVTDLIATLRALADTDQARKSFLDFHLNNAADALEQLNSDATLRIEWRYESPTEGRSEIREYRLGSLRRPESISLGWEHGELTLRIEGG